MTATTLNQIFFTAADRYRGRPAVLRHKHDGRWQDLPYTTLHLRVHRVYAALRALGLEPGSRVAILSENRPEWAIADYACLAARVIDVPIYPTLTRAQTAYILRDAGARLIFVSSLHHLDKILEIRHQLPDLRDIILFDGPSAAPGVTTLADFEAQGETVRSLHADWEHEALQVVPDDIATLIYTSGTTGDPKGVMLSHGNIASNVAGGLEVLRLDARDSCLSFLPLCHCFERMAGHYCMLAGGAVINYASSMDNVPAELIEVRPTVVTSVPRLYEKIYERVLDQVHRGSPVARSIFAWARRVGERRLDAQLAHRPVPITTALAYPIADRLVFAKLRQRTGGRIRFFISGSAPLSPEICRFFLAAGLTVLEGYGLTESSPVIAVNTFDRLKPGTVGPPLPGVEIRIAADGEILARGPGIMKGYFHQPEATAETIDHDRWLHTGDIGELDAEGFLRITDRKKDLIKTSGGKYVAPQPIEAMLKHNRFFANAVMLGDRHKFPIMLLVPNFDALRHWLDAQGIASGAPEQVVAEPQVRDMLEREARRSLRDLAQFEMPKKFLILPHDFTIDAGELTPTLKVKRNVVTERYREQIEALYAEA